MSDKIFSNMLKTAKQKLDELYELEKYFNTLEDEILVFEEDDIDEIDEIKEIIEEVRNYTYA